MSRGFLISVGALVTVLSLAPLRVAGQTPTEAKASSKAWTPSLTPDGQPDLQGVWLDSSATPLERPKALDGRQFLTDAEVAELKQRADRIFKTGDSDAANGDNVFLAALANPKQFKNNATGGAEYMIDRIFDNPTSLIVDPPDGKIPPITPAAQKRRSPEALALLAGTRPPARVQDVNSAIRCITPGVPRLGAGHPAQPARETQRPAAVRARSAHRVVGRQGNDGRGQTSGLAGTDDPRHCSPS